MNTDLFIFAFGLSVTITVFIAIGILMVNKYHVSLPETRNKTAPNREARETP